MEKLVVSKYGNYEKRKVFQRPEPFDLSIPEIRLDEEEYKDVCAICLEEFHADGRE